MAELGGLIRRIFREIHTITISFIVYEKTVPDKLRNNIFLKAVCS